MDIAATKSGSVMPASAAPAEKPAPADPSPEAPRLAEPATAMPEQRRVQMQEAIAEQVSRFLQTSARNLEFHVDGNSAMPVIIVRDGQGNVVRRIPGDEALQMLRLANAQSGTFIDSTA